MRKVLIFTFMLALIIPAAASGQDTLWSRTYGFASSSELGLCGNVTSDGGYVISGVSYQFSGLNGEFWLVRTAANGDTLWTRNYGGDRWQEAHYVIQTDDSGFALCGGTSVAVGDDDMFIVKTDLMGDTLWTNRFGVANEDDEGWAIIQTSDGGYLAVGHGYSAGNIQLFMVRMDTEGNQLWTKHYGGAYSDYAYGVVETADSGFALTGTYSTSYSSSDLWLLRTRSDGDTIWTKRFDFHSNKDRGDGIVLAPDGGFAIGGRTWDGTYPQLLVLRTDSLGNTLWSREFGGAADEFAESIAMTPDGGFVIGGGAGPYPFDFFIVRVNSTGDSLWAATYDYDGITGDSEDCYEVRVDANGDIMAYGYADVDPDGYNSEYWMLKIRDNAPPGPGFLAGQVFEEDGTTPIQDVTVSVYDSIDILIETDSTDLNGEFFFTFAQGTYYATFSKTYYNDTTLTNLVVVSAETTTVSLIMYASGYAYLPGDVNMAYGNWPPMVMPDDWFYIANGGPPCLLDGFWASADINGDCVILGGDVTALLGYFFNGGSLSYCPDYEPMWPTPHELPDDPPPDWPPCEAPPLEPPDDDVFIWFGNLDESPIIANINDRVYVDVYIQTPNSAYIADMHIPVGIENQYIDDFLTADHQYFYPLTGWAHIITNQFGSPPNPTGWSSQSILAFDSNVWLHFETPQMIMKIAIQTVNNPEFAGDTVQCIGIGSHPDGWPFCFGDTLGIFDYPITEYISPVFFNYPYLPGDVNMALGIWPPTVIGGDVTYLVGFFIGGGQESCLLNGFWASADINGDCLIIGGDVTALVGYFISGGSLVPCPDYEPVWPPVPEEAPAGWPNCDTPVINSKVIPTGSAK